MKTEFQWGHTPSFSGVRPHRNAKSPVRSHHTTGSVRPTTLLSISPGVARHTKSGQANPQFSRRSSRFTCCTSALAPQDFRSLLRCPSIWSPTPSAGPVSGRSGSGRGSKCRSAERDGVELAMSIRLIRSDGAGRRTGLHKRWRLLPAFPRRPDHPCSRSPCIRSPMTAPGGKFASLRQRW
jgi:hypothetical protein